MKKLIILTLLFLVNCSTLPWKNGKIYYNIEKKFNIYEKLLVEEAMHQWEVCGGIEFIPVKDTKKSDVYYIKKGKPNALTSGTSTFGYNKNGENFMILYDATLKTILHELGHCLGLFHEHQRYDRDLYIEIKWWNIYFKKWYNFALMNNKLITESKYKYDYKSIMHYSSRAFSKDGNHSIIPKDKKYKPEDLGSVKISEIDCQKIREIYNVTNK